MKLCEVQERDFELLDFKDKLIKQFMIDESTIKSSVYIQWIIPTLIPYGFFEKIKYYKRINKILEDEFTELKTQLNEYIIIETKKVGIKQIIIDLNKINTRIKNLISEIKLT